MARKHGTVFRTVEYTGNRQCVKVPIRIVSTDNNWHDKRISVSYAVSMDEPCSIRAEGQTPDEVRDVAFAVLDEFYAIAWKEYYLVEVSHNIDLEDCFRDSEDKIHPYRSGRFTIEYESVRQGVTKDGKKVHGGGRYRDGISNGEIDVGLEKGDDQRGDSMKALVPATPENKAALDSIIAALHALAKRVEKVMAPKEIQKTLLNSTKLLMPPEEKP